MRFLLVSVLKCKGFCEPLFLVLFCRSCESSSYAFVRLAYAQHQCLSSTQVTNYRKHSLIIWSIKYNFNHLENNWSQKWFKLIICFFCFQYRISFKVCFYYHFVCRIGIVFIDFPSYIQTYRTAYNSKHVFRCNSIGFLLN